MDDQQRIVQHYFAGVLPVSFISFNAVPGTNSNTLNWQVANANGVTLFAIERSTDGVHFTPAGNVTFNASTNQYTYIDDVHNLIATNAYYRIASINADGRISYSNIINIPLMNTTGNKVYAYSNLFKSSVQVIVKASAAGKAILSLYTSNGQLVSQINVQVQQGVNQLALNDLDSLAGGIYVLHVECNTESYTQKLIKE